MPKENETSSQKVSSKTNIILGKNLDDNVFQFKKVFKDDDTFMIRYFTNQKNPEARFCILFIDGMIDVDTVNTTIMEPIIQNRLPLKHKGDIDCIMNQVVINNHIKKSYSPHDMIGQIVRGESILLMDNCSEGLVISTRGADSRSITEPEGEKVIRGPREGFVEPILTNLSLIRRILGTPDLKFKKMTIGVQSKTKVSVCYIEGIVNQKILAELLDRLDKINIDGVMGSGYIAELISDAPYSPFKTIGNTERPDVAVAKLLEGRIVVIIDGSPIALTLPHIIEEYFQINEDYYINFYYSTFSRIIRILSFFITIITPAYYVSILTFHQEMLPTSFLTSIYTARLGIAFPTIIETLGMILIYEIFREAALRMPTTFAQSMSILGALILGTAAVDARIVSAPVIIVVALSGITGIMIPNIKGVVIILRFAFVILSGFFGLYGLTFGILGTVLHLCGIRSFGVPYMMSFTTLKAEDLKDTAVRAPIWFMTKRPKLISGGNKVKLNNRSK